MICNKCGNKLPEGTERCNLCEVQPETTLSNETKEPAKENRKNKFLPAIIAAVAVLVLSTVLWAAFSDSAEEIEEQTNSAFFERAYAHLSAEITKRTHASPLQMVGILADILNHGTLDIDFDYRNAAIPFGGNVSGRASLLSDARYNNYALQAVIGLMGGFLNIDFDARLNNERFALQSGLLGSDFYGFSFETFREDISYFWGPMIGLDNLSMDQMSDIVESIGSIMNSDSLSFTELSADYLGILADFISNLEYELEEETLLAQDGELIDVALIRYLLTHEDILALLNRVYAVLAEDDELRRSFAFYNMLFMQDTNAFSYDGFLSSLESMIRDFENSITGEAALMFYFDQNYRLAKADLRTDFASNGMPGGVISFAIDFGLSVYDPWVLAITLNPGPSVLGHLDGILLFGLEWNFSDGTSGFFMNEISSPQRAITLNNGTTISFYNVTSTWSPDDGHFSLHFTTEWYGVESASISGRVSDTDNGGLFIRLDELHLSPTETLSLDITASPGAEIMPVEFISLRNIDSGTIDSFNSILGLLP